MSARGFALGSFLVVILPMWVYGDPALIDSTDVRITPTSQTNAQGQTEPSVAIYPSRPETLLVFTKNQQLISPRAYVSTNGGRAWTGYLVGTNEGSGIDPSVAIDLAGRFFIGYLPSQIGGPFAVDMSTTLGASWTVRNRPASEGNIDKDHLRIDVNPNSPFQNQLYGGWTYSLPVSSEPETPRPPRSIVRASVSLDGGVIWSDAQRLSEDNQHPYQSDRAVNLATGPNGEVYATWLITADDGNAIGFARSLDTGGQTWPVRKRIVDVHPSSSPLQSIPLTVRPLENYGSTDLQVNSFPSMAIDQSTGNIYIVWANLGDPTGSYGDADIYCMKSADRGDTWIVPVRVNKDALGNGKPQFFPWIAWDNVTRALVVIFYDGRNPSLPNNALDVYVAVSRNAGSTWQDFKVSDSLGVYSGVNPVYPLIYTPGDYLGIAAQGARAYPVWHDDRRRVSPTFDPTPYTYSSRFLLWGPDQNTVSLSVQYEASGSMITLTSTWSTSISAPGGDQLVLTSPSGATYGASAVTCPIGPQGGGCMPGAAFTHSVTATVPCELGTWQYVVKSSALGTQSKSLAKTFKILNCIE